MTAALQLRAQLDVVVDLAVEGDPQRTVGAGHGLRAGRQIDDREAAMAEAEASAQLDAAAVGAR
ncbi:MAG: hypothetical protein U0168_27930 [Nannocystaceae bacterium]